MNFTNDLSKIIIYEEVNNSLNTTDKSKTLICDNISMSSHTKNLSNNEKDLIDGSIKITNNNNSINIIKEMDVENMERCVRSCITEAFEKNKGLFKRSKFIIK